MLCPNVDRHRAIIYIAGLCGWDGTVRVKKSAFIARHGLWTEEQRRKADELKRRVVKEDLNLVRLAWADPHGASRANLRAALPLDVKMVAPLP